jgi:hypothetical protein
MEHHLTRAIDKGYSPEKQRIETERIEYITIFDSITGEERIDSIIVRETIIEYQDRPLTRQERLAMEREFKHKERELRNELDKEKARFKNSENMAKIEAKTEKENTKRLKHETDAIIKVNKAVEKLRSKRSGGLRWFFIGVIVGAVGYWQRKNIWSLVRKFVLKV